MTLEIVVGLWPIFASIIVFVVWLARLEAGMRSNNRLIKEIQIQRKEDLEAAKEARDDTNLMLKEVRDDIKSLIRSVAVAVGGRQ